MTSDSNADSLRKRLLLPTLLLSNFVIFSTFVFIAVLLLDIATSFKVSIGTASQVSAVANLAAIFVGLAASLLAVRFKAKSIFLWGLVIYAIGLLGFFFAPNFIMWMIFAPVVEAGAILAGVMVFTLIGEQMSLQKRGWAVGLIIGASFAANFLVPLVSIFIYGLAGWRAVILWFLLPTTIVTIILGWLIVGSIKVPPVVQKPEFSRVFKQILSNKSAIACVVSFAFLWFGFTLPLYLTSFYRIHLGVTASTAAAFYSTVSFIAIFGAVACGRLINRVGRKLLVCISGFLCGLTTILMAFTPLGVSVALWVVNATTASMTAAAFVALVLEQVPEFRGSMMSVNATFRYIGAFLGPLVGGLLLNLYKNNFQVPFTIFGASLIACALVIAFFSKDPCAVPQAPT